jgi:hypothetical protein
MQNAVVGKQIKLGTYLAMRGITGCFDNRFDIIDEQQLIGQLIPFDNFDETISTTVSSLSDIGWRAAGESGSQSDER